MSKVIGHEHTHFVREIGEGGWRGVGMAEYLAAAADPTLDVTTIWQMHEAEKTRANHFQKLVNTPEIEDFMEGIRLEAAHQEQRWGTSHDEGKEPQDWYWLVGHLAGKALMSFILGDTEKAKHHVITTAAALANWHRKLCGSGTMRPGIAPPVQDGDKVKEYQEGVKAYLDGRTPCANPYLGGKNEWASGCWARGFRAAALKDTKEHG